MAMMPDETYDGACLRRLWAMVEAIARDRGESVSQILTENGVDTDRTLRGAVLNTDVGMVALLLKHEWTGVLSSESLREMDRAFMVITSIRGFGGPHGTFSYKYVRIIRLLVDAGADVSLQVSFAGPSMAVVAEESALDAMAKLKVGKTGEQLRKMDFLHRLLLRGEAGRAESWLWPAGPPAAPAKHVVSALHTMAVRRVGGQAATSRVVLRAVFR